MDAPPTLPSKKGRKWFLDVLNFSQTTKNKGPPNQSEKKPQ